MGAGSGEVGMSRGFVATASIVIEARAEKVWKALTDPAQIKRYLYGTEAISDWKVGSPIVYKGLWEGRPYEDKGRILEIEPGRLFRSSYWSAFSGLPDEPANYNTVTYELAAGESTTLSVTQDNIPSEEGRAQAEGNWRMVLQAIKELLEN
jgi:uncharacterized protein YndB with AHSA1/START domain